MPRGRPRKSPDDMLLKSAEMIGWALGGLEREIVATKDRLAALTAQAVALRKRVGVAAAAAAEGGRQRRRRTMSPEARKRISEMMKKRWAERRKAKQK
jgi:hypothetical protein